MILLAQYHILSLHVKYKSYVQEKHTTYKNTNYNTLYLIWPSPTAIS
jgi:hypothetical protein